MLFDLFPPALIALLLESIKQTLTMVAIAAILSTTNWPCHSEFCWSSQRPASFWSVEFSTASSARWSILCAQTPFIILMVAIISVYAAGRRTTVGTFAAIVPLTVAITPLFARLAEAAMREVDQSLIEAALSMGASPLQVILKVILPEALPGIIAGQW